MMIVSNEAERFCRDAYDHEGYRVPLEIPDGSYLVFRPGFYDIRTPPDKIYRYQSYYDAAVAVTMKLGESKLSPEIGMTVWK